MHNSYVQLHLSHPIKEDAEVLVPLSNLSHTGQTGANYTLQIPVLRCVRVPHRGSGLTRI